MPKRRASEYNARIALMSGQKIDAVGSEMPWQPGNSGTEQQPPAAPDRTRSNRMEVTYIEFMFPGLMVAETSSRPVLRRELPETIPGQATGYRFFARQETEFDGERLVGQPKNHSPWAYFGKEYSAAEVYALEGDRYHILRDNVRINGWKRMVQTIYGNWYPLQDGDQVVPDAGAERES